VHCYLLKDWWAVCLAFMWGWLLALAIIMAFNRGVNKFFKTLAKLARSSVFLFAKKTTGQKYRKDQWEGKTPGFVFLLANPEFYLHLASLRVVIRTPAFLLWGINWQPQINLHRKPKANFVTVYSQLLSIQKARTLIFTQMRTLNRHSTKFSITRNQTHLTFQFMIDLSTIWCQ
jgi:hypothetical protein